MTRKRCRSWTIQSWRIMRCGQEASHVNMPTSIYHSAESFRVRRVWYVLASERPKES